MIRRATACSSLLGFAFLVTSGCGGKPEKDSKKKAGIEPRMPLDTVVATYKDASVTYRDVGFRFDPEEWRGMAAYHHLPEMSEEEGDQWVTWQENDTLRRRLQRIIVHEALKDFEVVVPQDELDARLKRRLKELFGVEALDEEWAKGLMEKAAPFWRLIKTWHEDNERGEALYEKEFADKMSRDQWQLAKNRYGEMDPLPEITSLALTAAKNTEIYRGAVERELAREHLTARLRERGEIAEGKTLWHWVERRLDDVKILREEFASFRSPPLPTEPDRSKGPFQNQEIKPHRDHKPTTVRDNGQSKR